MLRLIGGLLAFSATALLVAAGPVVLPQPPKGGDAKKGPPGGQEKGPMGPPKYELGQLFPPQVLDELDLTADQQKKLTALQAEVKAKLEKILTAEQKKKIADHQPPMPMGGPGGGGFEKKGPPGGGFEKKGPGGED